MMDCEPYNGHAEWIIPSRVDDELYVTVDYYHGKHPSFPATVVNMASDDESFDVEFRPEVAAVVLNWINAEHLANNDRAPVHAQWCKDEIILADSRREDDPDYVPPVYKPNSNGKYTGIAIPNWPWIAW